MKCVIQKIYIIVLTLLVVLVPSIITRNLFFIDSSAIGNYRIAEFIMRIISSITGILFFDYKMKDYFNN
jgi:hypothetical protein